MIHCRLIPEKTFFNLTMEPLVSAAKFLFGFSFLATELDSSQPEV